MVGETSLPPDPTPIPDAHRPGKTDLGGNHAVGADLAVVADMDGGIEPRASSNHRSLQETSGDRAPGTDPASIAEHDSGPMRQIDRSARRGEAREAVATDDGPLPHLAVASHAYPGADEGTGRDPAARADHGLAIDHHPALQDS